MPASVARIKGLRSSSRSTPASPWRASIHTAARLAGGTMRPTTMPMAAMPGMPCSVPATARPM
jgi:hypothetical protein